MPRKRETIKIFPRRLRMAMSALGMNSADLMRKTTLGSSQISEYLNGHNEPTVTSLFHICEGMGVSADFLLGFSDVIRLKKRTVKNNGQSNTEA